MLLADVYRKNFTSFAVQILNAKLFLCAAEQNSMEGYELLETE